jgi:hypothetical protein
MVTPTTFIPNAVNTVTFKPADASQQSVSGNPQTQANKRSLSAQTSNDQSVTALTPAQKSDLAAILLPVKVQQQATTTSQLDVTIDNQQYQLNKTAQLQKLLQQTAQVVIASDQVKLLARAVSSVNQPIVQAEVINNQVSLPTLATASTGSTNVSPAQTVATQLVLLAQPIQLALPPSLEELAKQNGVSTQQLATLATRSQGYPLPTAVIDQGQLTFDGGTSIKLSPNTSLHSGQYLAKVVLQNQQLQLTLTPVIAEVNVNLTKLTQATSADQSANIVITRNEPAQILSQFLKKLESTQLPSPDNAVKGSDIQPKLTATFTPKTNLDDGAVKPPPASTQQITAATKSSQPLTISTNTVTAAGLTQLNNLQHQGQTQAQAQAITTSTNNDVSNKPSGVPEPIEVLNKALSKAGAMPIRQQLSQQVAHNLASELFKHLPQMSPHPLSALTDPALLSRELFSLAALNLAHTQRGLSSASQSSSLFSGSAITTLFQLLLGVKTKSAGLGISDKLQAHLAQLQQQTLRKLTANSGLLAALDRLGGADSLAQLASSVALYQQASSDPNQAMTWYFVLPYSINQRDEQLEGKFEQEHDQDNDKKTGWKLQLKFNLAQGSLLICAHKQSDVLDIQFKGNNQMLLAKVASFNQALADKITQIGFTPGKLTTQLTQIPATLLPGDHYLVKTRA